MASPGKESESLNSQFLVLSMPALWPSGACLATGEKFGYETRVRAADGESRWKLHCKVPFRNGRGNNFHVIDLVDRFRANDRTYAVTSCDPARALKFDSLWRKSVEMRSVPRYEVSVVSHLVNVLPEVRQR
jgi:hypothetical protein